jgi:hypothetical protein
MTDEAANVASNDHLGNKPPSRQGRYARIRLMREKRVPREAMYGSPAKNGCNYL